MPLILIDTTDLLNTDDAAGLIGISKMTLYRWMKDGKIIPIKFGRRTVIPKSEVERLRTERLRQQGQKT